MASIQRASFLANLILAVGIPLCAPQLSLAQFSDPVDLIAPDVRHFLSLTHNTSAVSTGDSSAHVMMVFGSRNISPEKWIDEIHLTDGCITTSCVIHFFKASRLLPSTGIYRQPPHETGVNRCNSAVSVPLYATDRMEIPEAELRLIPNPSNQGEVRVSWVGATLEVSRLEVLDAAGNLMRRMTLNPGTNEAVLNIDNLGAAFYVVRLTSPGRQITGRLIVH